jgi:RNA polymerase sigma-70 factor (ECF subfamily)
MQHTLTAEAAMEAGRKGGAQARSLDMDLVVQLYRPKVFRFALAWLRDPDAAETIAQDCFLRAHRTWNSFRHECSLETWLTQITVNLIRDYARNRRLQFWKRACKTAKPVESVSEWFPCTEPTAEAQLMMRQRVQAVWEAAAELPGRQRTVFLLRFVEDMELLDIAAATGMKEGTVKAHLFRAIAKIREKLQSRR